jgi:hypothetical protein
MFGQKVRLPLSNYLLRTLEAFQIFETKPQSVVYDQESDSILIDGLSIADCGDGYQVFGEYSIPGTRDCPPDVDVSEIGDKQKTFNQALIVAVNAWAKFQVDTPSYSSLELEPDLVNDVVTKIYRWGKENSKEADQLLNAPLHLIFARMVELGQNEGGKVYTRFDKGLPIVLVIKDTDTIVFRPESCQVPKI